jgi:hypothetical protein
MKRHFSVVWRPATLVVTLLLVLGGPFFIFIIVNSFRDSYKEGSSQYGGYGSGSYSSGSFEFGSSPSPHQAPKYEPGNVEVIDYFFEKNNEDARLKYIVDSRSKQPLDIQGIKGIITDFRSLIGDDLNKSAELLNSEKKSFLTPSASPSVPSKDEIITRELHKSNDSPPWYFNADSKGFKTLCRFALFSAAALFGALGAVMSLVTRSASPSPKQIGAIQVASLALIGAVFAFLLSIVFAGGLVAGVLFPQGHQSGDNRWFTVLFLHAEFSKLLVWSFLAGFSERLVPDLFQTLTSKFSTETAHKNEKS